MVHDDFAFDVHRGGTHLAKGRAVFLDEHGIASAMQSLNEETISTALGMGRRFAFTSRHNGLLIRLDVDVYAHLPNSVLMQWSLENIGTSTIKFG